MKIIRLLVITALVSVFTINPAIALNLDEYSDYLSDKILKPCEGGDTTSCISPIKNPNSLIQDFTPNSTKAIEIGYGSYTVGINQAAVVSVDGQKIGRVVILVQSKIVNPALFEGDEILVDSDNDNNKDLLVELISVDHSTLTTKLKLTSANDLEFSINKNLSTTNSGNVSLYFNVSNAVSIKVSSSGKFEEVDPIDYTESIAWILEEGEGLKTVHAQIKTTSGSYVYANDSITFTSSGMDTILLSDNEGKLIKDSNSSAIYLVENGVKKPIVSAKAFESYGYNWQDVSEADISSFPLGGELRGKPSARKLIKGSSNLVYYLSPAGVKRLIVSESVFNGLNYSWQDVITIADEELNNYNDGDDVFSTDKHPDGSLVKYKNGSKVYSIEDGFKRWVTDEASFNNNGFDWGDIIEIPSSETYDDGSNIGSSAMPDVFTLYQTIGSSNNEVKLLQDKLKVLGYFPTSVGSTGYYGSVTAQAVKDFQKASGIDQTGNVDAATRNILNS